MVKDPIQESRMRSDERQAKSLMMIGAGLALFGLVCPFFWISLIWGNSPHETWVYGVHSLCFIVIGSIILVKGWYDIKHPGAPVDLQKL